MSLQIVAVLVNNVNTSAATHTGVVYELLFAATVAQQYLDSRLLGKSEMLKRLLF
jgi:hypothetical protein